MTTSKHVIVTISMDDIKAKRQALREAEDEVVNLRQWLQAAEFLAGPAAKDPRETRSVLLVPRTVADRKLNGDLGTDLTKAIEHHAVAAPEPITKAELKERLRLEGFAEPRLQNFFYTVIARLKAKKRIQVLEDGRVWKPQ